MNKVVLVTGGAGYIGSHVCKALALKGFLPVAYDNLCSGNASSVKWGPFEKGDIRDRERLSEVISKYRPVAIMHFAALIQVGESVSDPANFYENNVYGSMCLLEEAREAGIDFMVFSSTAAVYGIPETSFLKETSALRPINPYGQTKLAMENMIRDYSNAYGLNFAILRYFNAAGADAFGDIGPMYKKDTHLIPLLMRVASNMMDEIKVFGSDYDTPDGTAIRDYIHVTDLANAHVLALLKIMADKTCLTLNLGTNTGHSVKEVLETAREVTGKKIAASNEDRREGDPPILVANAINAQKELDWHPAHSSLDNIIETAWKWRQKQNAAQFGLSIETPASWKHSWHVDKDGDFANELGKKAA
jgi:UDP-glucose-4-epimerase GalE